MSDTCPPPKSVLHRGKRYRIDDGDKIEDDKESSEDVVDINPGAMPQHSATPPSTGPSEPPRPPQQEDMHAALPLSISQQACRLGVSSPHGNRAGSQASSLARTPAALLQSDCGSQDDDLLVRWPSGASLTQGGARKAHQSADHDSALGSGSFIARELCRGLVMSSHTELNQRPASCSGVELNSERRQSAQLPDASSGTPTVIAATRLSQPGVTAQPIAGTPWCNTVWAYNMPSAQSALQGHAHMLHPSWAEPTQHMHPVAHQMGQPQSGTPQVYPTQPMPQPQQAAGPFFATPAMPQPQHVAGPYYATQMAHSQHMAAHVYPTQPVVQPQHVAGPYYATQGVSQLQQMASHHAHWTGLQGYPHGTAMPQDMCAGYQPQFNVTHSHSAAFPAVGPALQATPRPGVMQSPVLGRMHSTPELRTLYGLTSSEEIVSRVQAVAAMNITRGEPRAAPWLSEYPIFPPSCPSPKQRNAKRNSTVLLVGSGLTAAGLRSRHNEMLEQLVPPELRAQNVGMQTERGVLVRAVLMWLCHDLSETDLMVMHLTPLVRLFRDPELGLSEDAVQECIHALFERGPSGSRSYVVGDSVIRVSLLTRKWWPGLTMSSEFRSQIAATFNQRTGALIRRKKQRPAAGL